jgi:hypothetical protein
VQQHLARVGELAQAVQGRQRDDAAAAQVVGLLDGGRIIPAISSASSAAPRDGQVRLEMPPSMAAAPSS